MKPGSLIRAVIAFFAGAALAFGQAVTGSMVGSITDSSGGAVPNAKVTLTETNTGVSRNASSNESGNYTFQSLPPGTYSVSAELTGFKRAERPGVDVLVDTTQRVDLQLQPGN